MKKGLYMSVLRRADGYDATNGGVSSKSDKVFVIGIEGANFDLPTDGTPVMQIETINFRGNVSAHLVEVEKPSKGRTMAGGNYACCIDSRVLSAVEALTGYRSGVISIHDRVEV